MYTFTICASGAEIPAFAGMGRSLSLDFAGMGRRGRRKWDKRRRGL
ncbi:MAG: hypothetical protein ACR2QC_12465 [Gammaproteobacteria bacterium]